MGNVAFDRGSFSNWSLKAKILVIVPILLIIGVGIATMSGMFGAEKKSNSVAQQSAGNNEKPTPAKDVVRAYPQGEVVDGVKRFHITVNDRNVTAGPTTIEVKKNDKVLIEFVTDTDVEHDIVLEGYNIGGAINVGTVGQLAFDATRTGRFPITSIKAEDIEGGVARGKLTLATVVVTE